MMADLSKLEIVSDEEAQRLALQSDTHISLSDWGNCQICGEYQDRRCGACFTCSDVVDGEQLPDGRHRLWDSRNPSNTWMVGESLLMPNSIQ